MFYSVITDESYNSAIEAQTGIFLADRRLRNKGLMSVKKTRTGSLIILTFQERVRANPCEPPESHHWVHRLHPQLRGRKKIVRQTTVAVLKRNAAAGDCEIELRDISKLAPV